MNTPRPTSDQLALDFPDVTVAALIDPDTCITRFEGLPSIVRGATADQLRRALELLPQELQSPRGPVLTYALQKRMRK